jgi:hypothetical protein
MKLRGELESYFSYYNDRYRWIYLLDHPSNSYAATISKDHHRSHLRGHAPVDLATNGLCEWDWAD